MEPVRKHPQELWVLFFTEMWERFGYYLMLGIFSLYMLDALHKGGWALLPIKSQIFMVPIWGWFI
ncbi:POT family proton-dependent oligopeptide transporter [Breznakibacter xylanolyticus]|uniref:POT family proton-dependent oligopeptide transporter n=1 Tax=Breznakibacter xylanolyticus TaxID=990 RepID=A0A2W7NK71_9BACT|nr:hypothetical protein [Breznakibacter xylanolyticus]PZX13586.1 POT family proton-dependent oligopeptide transporter [Breznakibacter xylanolyticus]